MQVSDGKTFTLYTNQRSIGTLVYYLMFVLYDFRCFNKVTPIFQSISENGLVTTAVRRLWKMPLEKLCRRIISVSRCDAVLLDEQFLTFQGIAALGS